MVNCCTRRFTIVVSLIVLSSMLVQTANASSPSTVRVVGTHGVYTLPIVGVRPQYYVAFGYRPTLRPIKKLPSIDFHLTSAEAKQYAVYWMNLGGVNSLQQHGLEVLAPRNWIPVQAEVATDGSGDIILAASKSAKSPRLMFSWEWDGVSFKMGNTRHISASGVAMESIKPQWLFATGTVSRFPPKFVNIMEQFMVRVTFNSLRV